MNPAFVGSRLSRYRTSLPEHTPTTRCESKAAPHLPPCGSGAAGQGRNAPSAGEGSLDALRRSCTMILRSGGCGDRSTVSAVLFLLCLTEGAEERSVNSIVATATSLHALPWRRFSESLPGTILKSNRTSGT